MRRKRRALGAALLLVAPFALADDDAAMLRPGDSVRTSLAGSGEQKLVAFAGTQGTTLALRADAAAGSRATPWLSLTAPNGAAIALGNTNPMGNGHARAEGIVLNATGIWRIGVAAPPGHGGALLLSTRAEGGLAAGWTGTVDAAPGVDEHALDAAPGGRLALVVRSVGETEFDPRVELVSPSGEVIARAKGRRGRATLRRAVLPELGRYTVRVAGGPGSYAAETSIRPARARRRSFKEVASAPDVRDVSPKVAPNQQVLTLYVDGVGLSDGQTVTLGNGTSVVASGAVTSVVGTKGASALDLSSVPPGTYWVSVTTPEGRIIQAPEPVVVTNQAPSIVRIDPAASPNTKPFSVTVAGAGFDPTATLSLRHVQDGIELPVAITSRGGFQSLTATVTPSAFRTGPCDLEVRDPDGGRALVAGAVDLLGFRAAASPVHPQSAGTPRDYEFLGSASDTRRGRVLFALREAAGRVSFVLVDAATRTTVDSLAVDSLTFGAGKFESVRVAFDAIGDTFAFSFASPYAPTAAIVRVVPAADIHQTLAEHRFTIDDATNTTQIDAAPNRDDGGYLAVWHQYDPVWGGRILAQRLRPDGSAVDAPCATVLWSPNGNFASPVAAYQRQGRFVVAWVGLNDTDQSFAVRAALTDATGTPVPGIGPYTTATSSAWGFVTRPELAVNPADGSMLLAFQYLDGIIYRPACQRLAPATAYPSTRSDLDAGLIYPGGRLGGVAWNAARGEFVTVSVGYDGTVTVRRVGADGTLVPAPVVEAYEGTSGLPYGGGTAGSLGLARVTDGVDDGVRGSANDTNVTLVVPLR